MNYFKRKYNDLKNKHKYKSHTLEITHFVKESYPALAVSSILGPLFDNEENLDSEERQELYYLITFQKDCPENQIHLKINKATKKVSEVERY